MLIKLEGINKKYTNKITRKEFYAVKDVNIEINKGEIVGLSGESGSGKSTVGQIITGLLKPTSGKIIYMDNNIRMPFKSDIRKEIQIIFQHPEVSFNPRMKLFNSLKEAYYYSKTPYTKEELLKRLSVFGLYEEHLDRYPSELSGGELQRASIIRALTFNPELLVLDEATSMLDTISQAQIISLLKEYQENRDISYLFISHDKLLLEEFCHRIYYINKGIVFVNKEYLIEE